MLFNSLRIYFRSGFCINFRFIYKNFRGEENKKEGSISFLLLKCSSLVSYCIKNCVPFSSKSK